MCVFGDVYSIHISRELCGRSINIGGTRKLYGLCTTDSGGVVEDTVRMMYHTYSAYDGTSCCAHALRAPNEIGGWPSLFINAGGGGGVHSSTGRVYTISLTKAAAKTGRPFFYMACQKKWALLIGSRHCNFGDAPINSFCAVVSANLFPFLSCLRVLVVNSRNEPLYDGSVRCIRS